MKYSDSFWEWKPLISFGIFRFGSHLRNYKRLRLVYLKKESTIYCPEETTYDADGYDELSSYTLTLPNHWKSLRIYINARNRIDSVMSKKLFMFRGKNFIGLRAEQICDFLGKMYDSHDDIGVEGESWFSYTFDDLGLFLWEEDGIITSITTSLAYED